MIYYNFIYNFTIIFISLDFGTEIQSPTFKQSHLHFLRKIKKKTSYHNL